MLLIRSINSYIGRIYYEKGDYKNYVKYIYKCKEIAEVQFGNFCVDNIRINIALGKGYLDQSWLDESLKHFNLAKDICLKLWGNERSIWDNANLVEIEYEIALIYFYKGEISKPLESFENLLFLLEQGKVHNSHSTYRRISLNINIAHLYNRLFNKDKFNYHIETGLKIFDSCINDINFEIGIIGDILPAVLSIGNYKRCEEICLKLLELLQDGKNDIEKIIIYSCLMNAYAHQENYEKSNEIFDIIESKLAHADWHEWLSPKAAVYCYIGEALRENENYNKADI